MFFSRLFEQVGIVSIALGLMCSCYGPAGLNSEHEIDSDESQLSNLYVTSMMSSPWTQTRAGEETIPLPVRYYLFDSDGLCVDYQEVNQLETGAVFKVERGVYTVAALCGSTSSAPDSETATIDASVAFVATSDLCLGSKVVDVSDYGSSNDVTIEVNHLFSKLSLAVTSVPSSVSAISVTLCGLYSSVSLEGEYADAKDLVMTLSPETETPTTWSIGESLVYPGSVETMIVKLTITSTDGQSQVVQTTTDFGMKAGVMRMLSAKFSDVSKVNPVLNLGTSWTSESGTLSFWGEEEQPSGENEGNPAPDVEGTDPGQESDGSYSAGDKYKEEGFVLSVDADNETMVVVRRVVNTKVKYSAFETTMDDINGASADDPEWRIPTNDEFSLLMGSYTKDQLVAKISSIGGESYEDVPFYNCVYNKNSTDFCVNYGDPVQNGQMCGGVSNLNVTLILVASVPASN